MRTGSPRRGVEVAAEQRLRCRRVAAPPRLEKITPDNVLAACAITVRPAKRDWSPRWSGPLSLFSSVKHFAAARPTTETPQEPRERLRRIGRAVPMVGVFTLVTLVFLALLPSGLTALLGSLTNVAVTALLVLGGYAWVMGRAVRRHGTAPRSRRWAPRCWLQRPGSRWAMPGGANSTVPASRTHEARFNVWREEHQ
ncbi:hypothetical protein ONA91_37640 [Micromonospora sp. DR5-3]|uniref:hypothetical protein n=1 Tax=unclassified Micromonospora TaxID=2617518 RepID=UPI0011D49A21|nr:MULTISPECIES: hypothetical protein [unclassified Micromonospora]MCW3820169.1 hypothetical protein [Micromonospora sp. DR5-3]TYC20672.1 hypothetical protein FXF52_30200 [Micromonospora sp. MP36]